MLGDKLKTLRGNRRQEDVAKSIGISRARYSHYENGIREPDNDTLNRLADYYGASVDYLLGRTSEIYPKQQSGEPFAKEEVTDSKEQRDIAKRLEQFREEIENSDGLAFDGEPMSEEAKESLIESMEHIYKMTQRINKKFTPNKYK